MFFVLSCLGSQRIKVYGKEVGLCLHVLCDELNVRIVLHVLREVNEFGNKQCGNSVEVANGLNDEFVIVNVRIQNISAVRVIKELKKLREGHHASSECIDFLLLVVGLRALKLFFEDVNEGICFVNKLFCLRDGSIHGHEI
jgi:hypothetical protein